MKTTQPSDARRRRSTAGLWIATLLACGPPYCGAPVLTAQATPPAPNPVVVIEVSQFAFGTERLHVATGTTVRWVNEDLVPHSVTSDEGLWSSHAFGHRESYERTFFDSGEFSYHCTPHPFMKGVVVVGSRSATLTTRAARVGGG